MTTNSSYMDHPAAKDQAQLAKLVTLDRARRGMSWGDYAKFISEGGEAVGQSTLYKIGTNRLKKKSHDTTIYQILRRIHEVPGGAITAEGASSGEVSESSTVD